MQAARALLLLAVLPFTVASSSRAVAQDARWDAVDQAIGRKGAMNPGGVQKYGFARGDLQVTLGDVAVKPALALGGWAAFNSPGDHAMMMGDLVLAQDEVDPVMRALQRGGIEITALHNHLLGESPRVMYMHVLGHGHAVALAKTIHDAIALTKAPAPSAAAPAATIDLDTAAVAKALGHAGKVNGGVLQVSVPRREPVREAGHVVPPAMGVATAMNFQPTGNGRAAITGDFVLIASEVNPVIRALHDNGIQVTALHSHMLRDEPRLFFMHFWANDDAVKLATGLHAALGRMAVKKP